MSNAPDLIAVHVTTSTQEQAAALAEAILSARLGACIQTQAIESRYRWEGKVACEKETLLVIKTLAAAFEPLAALVREMHAYDEPEILALPVLAASPGYTAWVRENVEVDK